MTGDEVKILFDRLIKHFKKGEIIFDVLNSFVVKAGKKGLKETTNAEHKWVVDNTEEIDSYNKKLKRKNNNSVFNLPCLKYTNMRIKIFCKMAHLIKKYRNILRLMRYEF